MRRRIMTHAMTSLACLGCLLTTSAATAEPQNQSKTKQKAKQAKSSKAKENKSESYYKTAKLPKQLQKLDLTSEQKTKIKKTMLEHQRKFRDTWKNFHAAHAQAINLEATWYAAVRDTLSEEDQKTFDRNRMNNRKSAKEKQGQASTEKQKARQKNNSSEKQTKTASKQDAKQKKGSQKVTARKPVQSGEQQQKSKADESAEGFVIVTVTSPVIYLEDVQQSASQKHQCSEVCRKYEQKLSMAWKKIHRLHNELVKIEARKIETIEDHLTDEQLTQLRKNRQKPSEKQETASSKSSDRS